MPTVNSGIRGIFFKGGNVTFPDFFLRVKCFFHDRNFHLGRPKISFSGFKKWQGKNKEKEKSSALVCPLFPPYICNFPPSLFKFSCISTPFSIFSLPLFSWLVNKNFPVTGTVPPAPSPVMPLMIIQGLDGLAQACGLGYVITSYQIWTGGTCYVL